MQPLAILPTEEKLRVGESHLSLFSLFGWFGACVCLDYMYICLCVCLKIDQPTAPALLQFISPKTRANCWIKVSSANRSACLARLWRDIDILSAISYSMPWGYPHVTSRGPHENGHPPNPGTIMLHKDGPQPPCQLGLWRCAVAHAAATRSGPDAHSCSEETGE